MQLVEHPSRSDYIPPRKLPPSGEVLLELKASVDKLGIQMVNFIQCMLGARLREPAASLLVSPPEVSNNTLAEEIESMHILDSRT